MKATLNQTEEEIEILVSPDIQEEEIILGWQDMITFNILKKKIPLPCKRNKKQKENKHESKQNNHKNTKSG